VRTTQRAIPRTEGVVVSLGGVVADAIKVITRSFDGIMVLITTNTDNK